MEKLFYTAKDVSKILGYKLSKAYAIIKQLNIDLQNENKDIMTFDGRIQKKYFDRRIGIERGDQNERHS